MRTLTRAALGAAMAAPLALGFTSAAHAEQAPNCSSAVQIGQTAYLNADGQTFASVKQFKGCGLNFAYLYVWQSYRSSHGSWNGCAGVGVVGASPMYDTNEIRCTPPGAAEVWSTGRATLSQCTVATGAFDSLPGTPAPSASTDVRC